MLVVVDPSPTAMAIMRIVKAAIEVRQIDMNRCTGASVHALNELYRAVDALTLAGAEAGFAELIKMT